MSTRERLIAFVRRGSLLHVVPAATAAVGFLRIESWLGQAPGEPSPAAPGSVGGPDGAIRTNRAGVWRREDGKWISSEQSLGGS